MNNVLVNTENLKLERRKKLLTYSDMAALLGYKSKSTYMYIEKGITTPRLPIMKDISRILEKPIDYFFNLEVQENQTICQDIKRRESENKNQRVKRARTNDAIRIS